MADRATSGWLPWIPYPAAMTRVRARDAGVADAQRAAARDEQRQVQFLLDFIEAENSMGFHARKRPCVSWRCRSITRARDK